MYCPRCGNACSEGARFCGSCGSVLPIATKETPASPPVEETPLVTPTSSTLPEVPCPYCGASMKPPSSKRKCPACGRTVLMRTDPDTKSKVLVTEEGAKRIDDLKADYAIMNLALKYVNIPGVDDKQKIIEAREELSARDGRKWGTRETIWHLCNKYLEENEGKDRHADKMLYYGMAIFVSAVEDPNPYLAKAARIELELMGPYVKKVEVCCTGGCESCQGLKDKMFTVEEALQTMPLPNKGCTFKLDGAGFPFCRCCWVAVPE